MCSIGKIKLKSFTSMQQILC